MVEIVSVLTGAGTVVTPQGEAMDKMLSYCGIRCDECGAFVATVNDDDARRAEVAREWSSAYGVDLSPEDIHCSGCLTDGPDLFHHPKVCEIRACAREQGVTNCAYCHDYACSVLEALFEQAPALRATLDRVRESL